MPLNRIRPSLSTLVVIISFVVLLVAGLFLYRWVNHLSDLDRQHQQEGLDASMINFERGFSVTLREAIWFFRPTPAFHAETPWQAYSELYSQWEHTARWPQLVSTITIAFRPANGVIVLRRLDSETNKFEEQQWPPSLEIFRKQLEGKPRKGEVREASYSPRTIPMDGRLVLALPILTIGHTRPNRALRREFRHLHRVNSSSPPSGIMPAPPGALRSNLRRFPRAPLHSDLGERLRNATLAGWCFLEFNQRFIQTQLLPFLVGQYFGPADLAKYHVAVLTGNPGHVIYASDRGVTPASMAAFDARITLFSSHARNDPFLPARVERLNPSGRRVRAAAEGRRWIEPPSKLLEMQNQDSASNPDAWQLVAKDKLGSIGIAVDTVRRRDLAIGFGTLLLLACSIATLLIAAHRARSLAKRQMEFVAGISHELRTPLAVIESAGFNLARGIVNDWNRVRQYGEVIQTEGRRLSGLVGQTLDYAGVHGGRHRYVFEPLHVLKVVDAALAEYDFTFSQEGWQVEKKLESNLPHVSADVQAFRSAVKNLIENALKYATNGKWLGVNARSVGNWRGAEVQISIEDHGPGIDPADLPHIFEPFYRGQKVVASTTPGAGLGLSLVEQHMQAHGGRVSVRTVEGSGTEFTLHLPCA